MSSTDGPESDKPTAVEEMDEQTDTIATKQVCALLALLLNFVDPVRFLNCQSLFCIVTFSFSCLATLLGSHTMILEN